MPSRSELEAALLTPAEVGSGFTQQPQGSGISENSLNSACPALRGGPNPSAMAIRAFAKNPGSIGVTDVTEELLQYTTSEAKAQLNQFAQVARECRSTTVVIPTSLFGQPIKLTVQIGVAIKASPDIGDQAAAVSVTANVAPPGVNINGDIVAVRHGGTVILVVNVALNVDSVLTGSVVNDAYKKVSTRW